MQSSLEFKTSLFSRLWAKYLTSRFSDKTFKKSSPLAARSFPWLHKEVSRALWQELWSLFLYNTLKLYWSTLEYGIWNWKNKPQRNSVLRKEFFLCGCNLGIWELQPQTLLEVIRWIRASSFWSSNHSLQHCLHEAIKWWLSNDAFWMLPKKPLLIALCSCNYFICPYFLLNMNPILVRSSMVQLCHSFWLVIFRDENQGIRGVGWGNMGCPYTSTSFNTSGKGSKLGILEIFCNTNKKKWFWKMSLFFFFSFIFQ